MSRILTILLICVSALIHVANARAETAWIADEKGCKVANPNPQANESISWSGRCEDGFAHGAGTLQWFEDGKPTGRYEGDLDKGWANGKGVLTNPNGTVYKGQWKDSRENGEGRLDWPDGSWYEGEWRDGKPNGYGQYRSPDGKMLTGKFVDGVFEPDDKEQLQPGQSKT